MNDVQGAADRDLALSVVVMGYRNRDTIVRAVRSVVDQASPGPFEVVVVTSGESFRMKESKARRDSGTHRRR